MKWHVTHLDEIEPLGDAEPGAQERLTVRHRLGIGAFGVNGWVARNAGDLVIEEHTEDTTVLAIGATRGEPFEVSTWERRHADA